MNHYEPFWTIFTTHMVSSMSICFWQAHFHQLHRSLHRKHDGKLVDLHWRSEERRVGKESRSRWSLYHYMVVLKNSQCFDQIFGNLHFNHLSTVQASSNSILYTHK